MMDDSKEITEREASVAPPERIFTLDALRGFALIGIALINVQALTDMARYAPKTANELVGKLEHRIRAGLHP